MVAIIYEVQKALSGCLMQFSTHFLVLTSILPLRKRQRDCLGLSVQGTYFTMETNALEHQRL